MRPSRWLTSIIVATAAMMAIQSTAASAASCIPTMTRAAIQERAGYGVGYSYWWGHGRWSTGVNTSDGSCCGTCGDADGCGHYASKTRNATCSGDQSGVTERGADCSGYVSTAWQLGPSCSTYSITAGGHPYSTYDFRYGSAQWARFTDLSALKNMDGAVRYDSSAHHIVLFNGRDSYGVPLVYEAKGCSSGIVYGKRTLDSNWIGVRRDNLV